MRGFGGSPFHFSEVRLAAGKRDEARQPLESALELYQEAAARFPTMSDLRQEEALMHRKLAELSESEELALRSC